MRFIAIINHGRIIVNESKKDLVGRLDSKEIIFRLDRSVGDIPALAGYKVCRDDERSLRIGYAPKEMSAGHLIEIVQMAGYGIVDISTQESDLEDVFLQLTRNPEPLAAR